VTTRTTLHALATAFAALTLAACAGHQDYAYTRAGPTVPQLWPVSNSSRTVSSAYGSQRGRGKNARFHKGIDIPSPRGTPVVATAAGTVALVRSTGDYGRYIVLDHANGYQTLYAHLNDFAVRSGDRVGAGQTIGSVGKSGNATGYHLHYEVHRNGQTVDPIAYVPR